tara:strand:+ start:425 stop:676 length:252 start_codon:yes stop_codon:yes gene_type:complete
MLGIWLGFNYGGADRIIATVNPVNDGSTPILMEEYHKQYLRTSDHVKALQIALKNFRKKELADVSFKYPYYWSPFIAIGIAPQ